MVGASGAISGVMGAYVLLYPRVRVHTLIVLGFFITTVALPAYVMLGYWFLVQLVLGAAGALSHGEGGVAFWAHVGGFVAGMALIRLFTNPDYLERRRGGMVILPRDPLSSSRHNLSGLEGELRLEQGLRPGEVGRGRGVLVFEVIPVGQYHAPSG